MALVVPQNFLDLKRIRYVVAIAEHRSVSAAARHLNVAQPALSYHLAELERQVGAVLFDRVQSGVVPTALGLVFLEHARTILAVARGAEDDLRRHVVGAAAVRSVRLALIPSLTFNILPVLIDAFRARLRDSELHVIEARTAFAQQLIDTKQADVAILLVPSETDDPILAWEDLYWIVRAGDGSGDVAFAEAAASPLVLPSQGNPLRQFLELQAAAAGASLNISMEIDGFEPRKRVVVAGRGTTIIGGRSIGQEELSTDLRARRIVAPTLQRPIVMRFRSGLDAALRQSIERLLFDVFRLTV